MQSGQILLMVIECMKKRELVSIYLRSCNICGPIFIKTKPHSFSFDENKKQTKKKLFLGGLSVWSGFVVLDWLSACS